MVKSKRIIHQVEEMGPFDKIHQWKSDEFVKLMLFKLQVNK